MSVALIIIFALIICIGFCRSFGAGMGIAVFFLMVAPREMRIQTSGALPEITFHRIAILICWIFWLVNYRRTFQWQKVPEQMFLRLFICTTLVSALFSITPAASFKNFLSYLLEIYLFLFLVCQVAQDEKSLRHVWTGILAGLTVVALLTWCEKYGKINLAERVVGRQLGGTTDITASYPHRILLGYAMAIATILFVAHAFSTQCKRPGLAKVFALVCVAACYFSRSRGPWLGLLIGLAIFYFIGTPQIRRFLNQMLAIAIALLLLNPGVRGTIMNLTSSTFEEDSLKGKSAQYRLELWTAIFHKIGAGGKRIIFGYGGQSHEHMDLSDLLTTGGRIDKLGYTSIDSQYAIEFLEFGFLGLILISIWYSKCVFRLWEYLKTIPPASKPFWGGIFSGLAVYLFAMSNVAIFAPNLQFLFLTLLGVGYAIPHLMKQQEEAVMNDPYE